MTVATIKLTPDEIAKILTEHFASKNVSINDVRFVVSEYYVGVGMCESKEYKLSRAELDADLGNIVAQ